MTAITLGKMTNGFLYPAYSQSAAVTTGNGDLELMVDEALGYHYEYTANNFKRETLNELTRLLYRGQEDISPEDINLDSFVTAMRFIEMLPSHFLPPEVYLSDDGRINFDWEDDSDWSLTLIFNENSTNQATIYTT